MERPLPVGNELLTLDLDQCFDIIIVANRHNREAGAEHQVAVAVEKQQPDDESLRRIKLSGTLIEAGLGDIFWEKVSEFETARLERAKASRGLLTQ